MVTRLGIIGVSPENGHPYSFSALFNGYDSEGFKAAGWELILNNFQKRSSAEIGLRNAKVTHAWTQDPAETKRLCRACLIPNSCLRPEEFLNHVDAVIIARDDAESHWPLAQPFLEAGLPVFVDKPLTMDPLEFDQFRPYLESGQLVSGSAMRFARELDELPQILNRIRPVHLIRATVVKGWDQYGIHMLEALAAHFDLSDARVLALPAPHESIMLTLRDGTPVHIDALGNVPILFALDVYGQGGTFHADLRDNLTMFQRLLDRFVRGLQTREPAIDPRQTQTLIQLLQNGRRALDALGSNKSHEITV